MDLVPLNEDVVEMALRIYEARGKEDLKEVFLSAVGIEEILRVARRAGEVQALQHIPAVLQALRDAAVEDRDVKAARLVMETAGLIGQKAAVGAAVVNQINISPQEIARLERDLLDTVDVD